MASYCLVQATATRPLLFHMVLSSDHVTEATGNSPTVVVSKNGAAFAPPSGTVAELDHGWYQVAGDGTDTDTVGPLLLYATAANCDAANERYEVVAIDPGDAVRFGMTALPAANASATGGLGCIVVQGGTAQAGATNSITLSVEASVEPDYHNGAMITLVAGTGAGQTRVITRYTFDQIATVDRDWVTVPDETTVYEMKGIQGVQTDSSGLVVADYSQIAAAIFDAGLADHRLPGTLGQRLQPLHAGTAQDGTSVSLVLDSAASGEDEFYNNGLLVITGGAGAGQARFAASYEGSSHTVTVANAWATVPDVTSEFVLLPFDAIATQIFATVLPELPQALPAATPTFAALLMALYMDWRNATTVTDTQKKVRDAAGTVVFRADLSDDETVFTKSQFVGGP